MRRDRQASSSPLVVLQAVMMCYVGGCAKNTRPAANGVRLPLPLAESAC
jgi:hypothetical protein